MVITVTVRYYCEDAVLVSRSPAVVVTRVILDSGGARVTAHFWWEVCVGTYTFYTSTHLNCAADESSAAV